MSLDPLQPIPGTNLHPISSGPSLLGHQYVTTNRNEAILVARAAWMLYRGPNSGAVPSTEPKVDRGRDPNDQEIDKYFHPRLIFSFGHAAILLNGAAQPVGLRFQGSNHLNPAAAQFEIWDVDLAGQLVGQNQSKLPPRPE